jgi:surface antigen
MLLSEGLRVRGRRRLAGLSGLVGLVFVVALSVVTPSATQAQKRSAKPRHQVTTHGLACKRIHRHLRCASINTAHRRGHHLAIAHGGRGGGNPYAGGGCTSWAWANRPDLPAHLGDARFWATNAARAGFPVNNTPEAGAIAVYQPGSYGAFYPWGHVAVVTAVQPGRVQLSEANYPYDTIIYRGRWTGIVGVQFIHHKGWSVAPPQPAPSLPTVQFVSPVQGQILSGVATLTARTTNASGVEFDAYYATDPGNIGTVGWHKLGIASTGQEGQWSMSFDTRAIPDQGNAGWGTVNIAASPLDRSGNQTPARDYRLTTIANANSSVSIGLQNSSFEASAGCGIPPGWFFSRADAYGSCIYKDPATAYDGANFLDVETGSPWVSVAQDVAVIPGPGERYVLTAYVRSPPGVVPGAQGRLALWALGGSEEHSDSPFTTTSSWQKVSITLSVGNSGHSALRTEIYYDSAGWRVLLDDVTLSRVG